MRKMSASALYLTLKPYPKRGTEPQLTPERFSTDLAHSPKGVVANEFAELRFSNPRSGGNGKTCLGNCDCLELVSFGAILTHGFDELDARPHAAISCASFHAGESSPPERNMPSCIFLVWKDTVAYGIPRKCLKATRVISTNHPRAKTTRDDSKFPK